MANVTVSDLHIDGVKMPTPAAEGITISSEKIWSSDTGRTATGKMVGTIVDIKTTVKITWPPLSMAEVKKIENVISNRNKPFVSMTFTDMTGETVTKIVYFGTPSYTIYSWAPNLQHITGLTVSGIEQ